MASPPDGRFPPEILSSDDTPSSGYFSITLTIPGMKTKKGGLFDKVGKVTNGQTDVHINDGDVSVHAKIDEEGKATEYSYNKKLPEKINISKSKYKLEKEQIRLILSKTKKESWVQYADHFGAKPQ